jgi:hypothetical protein
MTLEALGRTFPAAGIKLGSEIDLGFGGKTVVWGVQRSFLANATKRATTDDPGRLLFNSMGKIVVRVSAHDPPGAQGRVNTMFHVLNYTLLDGVATIRAGGISFPLTLPV